MLIMIKKYLAFCIVLLIMLFSATAFEVMAEDGDDQEENWSFVLYNSNSGMPFSEANMLEQTRDGFIYIGCYGGLLRFDGENFYRFDDPQLNNIKSLFDDSRERLWIATNSNGFAIMEKGETTFYGTEDGLDAQYVYCFEEDEKGNILIGTVSGLYYMDPENKLHKIEDSLLNNSTITMLRSDGRGRIYGLTRDSDVFAIQDLDLISWNEKGTFTRELVTCIYPDPNNDGYVYMGQSTGGILHGSIFGRIKKTKLIPTPDLIDVDSILYEDGRLWIASNSGIGFINREGDLIRPDKMQRSNASRYLMADLEGNIWVASDRLGVIKLSPSIFCNINSQAQLPDMVVNTTCVKDGLLYIGSDIGLVCLDKDYNQVETPVSELLANSRIRCIKEDRNGCLWFCTYGDTGLVSLKEDGTVRSYTVEDGFKSNSIREVYEMSDGTLVVSAVGGLYLLRDGEIAEKYEQEDGLTNPLTLTECEYGPGKLLLGLDGNGILLLEDGILKAFPEAEELSSDVILRIRKNEEQDSYWIVTADALCILHDGHIQEVSMNETPNLHRYDVEFDDSGNAWLFAGDGIYVGNADEILAGKQVRYIHYDYRSGLPFIATPHCRNYVSDDGVVYMAGNDGVARISINQVRKHKPDVQLQVPYMEADDEIIYLTPGEEVVLPPWTRKIWVHPFALSYSLSEPIVAYGLEGFDDELNIATRSDLPSVIYTNLRGGSYKFRFALVNPVTGEFEKETDITIVKRKALHERVSFWILLAAIITGAVMFINRLYLEKKAREMEAEKEQDRIRTELSVARDIQTSMLPRVFPEKVEIDLYASMTPAKEVAGDFYDFFKIDDDHIALIIADVSGKGVGAALFMMVAKNTIKNCALSNNHLSPGEILEEANNKLCEDNEALLFVTVWLGIFTLSTGELVSANGGHEYPVIYRSGEGYTLVKDKHGLALGIMEDIIYEETKWVLGKDDGIFVYTDGIPEATDAENELFGNERMLTALNHYAGCSSEEVLNGVHREVDEFVGQAPRFDDLTMLAMTYLGQELVFIDL